MEFKNNYIYIDKRESNQTIKKFNELMFKNTFKNEDGSLKLFDENNYRLKLTGGKFLEYKGSIETILPVGDYMWNNHAFELKRGYDLKDSVTGEVIRLDKQIDNAKKLLRNGSIKSYTIFCTMEGGFTGNKFNEFNYFSSQPGIQVMQYYDLDYCFKAMFNTWNTINRLTELHPNYIPQWNPAVSFLYACDSCSESIIKKIYNHFDIVYIDDLEKITINKLQEIRGIGLVKSEQIFNEIQKKLHRPVNNTSKIIWDTGGVIVY